jgi:periplasmic protein TonB
MFDAVLNRANTSRRRFGLGATFALTLHAGAIALLVWASTTEHSAKGQRDLSVKFMKLSNAPPPPPPPPPKLLGSTPKTHRVEHRLARRPDTVVQPKEIPKEKPREAEPEPERKEAKDDERGAEAGGLPGGVAGGTLGGVVGGVLGGVPGGQLGGQLGSSVLPFGEGMTRTEQTSGEPPKYTREALAAHVQGTMLVKCVITVAGILENCRIIKAVPHMDKAVLDALSTWRYKPVHFQGRPVAVDYLIQIKLVIPH